ncbi:MAG TPA: NF038122 family metalloprotease [Phenylobacterium sp.]|uniref:NF038122 family metalloprotease n=1 Tax=Phenylobacterium sp. TaxID=1871053 RepID=UPI002D3AB97A|nr:NF038122 family metalloprotease [Phenylobacterium sp.]HZZ69536.1 NF038122 family metalloprotease [Phenylobacterium sp.]
MFDNTYGPGVTDAYRNAVITAENFLQTHFVNAVTVGVTFDLQPITDGVANNAFFTYNYSYATVTAALASHATTVADSLAVAALPAADPSHGLGFALTAGQAQALGLMGPTGTPNDDSVVLSSTEPWTFGQDAVGALEHEITEGVFGRNQSLGIAANNFTILDLFRYTVTGQHDYTGGSDGALAIFGVDSTHLSDFVFHNAINAAGVNDGQDLGDWDFTFNDAFGAGGGGISIGISSTDLTVLDVIGWTPPAAPLPGTDDFANSFTDTSNPFGQIVVGTPIHGSLEIIGDRDWLKVQLNAGTDYVVSVTGETGGGGTLDDSVLRLHDATGAQIAINDDVNRDDFDSGLVLHPTASGTYYVEVGSFDDQTSGTYTVSVTAGAPAPTAGNDFLVGQATGSTIDGGSGADTITADSGTDYLRGGDGDDVIVSGAGFDDINGNKGNDTIDGGVGGSDWLVGGQGDDSITAHVSDNLVYGNLGNDTLVGGTGADIIRGGQGDDSIVAGSGNQFLSGDRGNDTIQGGSGADTFHGSQDAGIDRVLGFHLAQGDRVELDPGTTYSVSQVGADTVIDMGGGNQMVLVGVQMSTLTGNWIFEG